MIEIVPFTPEYAAGVVELILPIQQKEFGLAITLAAQPDLQDIGGFYQHGAGNLWIALDGPQVVGSVALLDIGRQQAALRKMFVARPYRGARHGIASSLLARLLAWGQAHEVRELYLGTTSSFLAAHRFYAKHGFRDIARSELPASFPLMQVDSKFYRLALDATDAATSEGHP